MSKTSFIYLRVSPEEKEILVNMCASDPECAPSGINTAETGGIAARSGSIGAVCPPERALRRDRVLHGLYLSFFCGSSRADSKS